MEPEVVQSFRKWLTDNGGELHRDIEFCQDVTGLSIKCTADLPADTSVVSCPFSLAITLGNVQDDLQFYCNIGTKTNLSERQRICTYISLHWIIDQDDQRLRHRPYLNILPKPQHLLTPLYFSDEELDLFSGTNLLHATLSQRAAWKEEWVNLQSTLRGLNTDLAQKLTWDMYLASATYLSSRAFPSTLLSANPSLVAAPSSYQILLPGVDSLNHARGTPVTWNVVRKPTSGGSNDSHASDLCLALTLNSPYCAGSELFNNYGPKPNSSLILGYGFATKDNPDDTIMLKIGFRGGQNGNGTEGQPPIKSDYEVGRDARGADHLWDSVRALVAPNFTDLGDDDGHGEDGEDADVSGAAKDVQIDIQAADTLSNMVSDLLDRLPILPVDESGSSRQEQEKYTSATIRPEVRTMWFHYVQGQVDILNALQNWIEQKERQAIRHAEELGINIAYEGGSDESE